MKKGLITSRLDHVQRHDGWQEEGEISPGEKLTEFAPNAFATSDHGQLSVTSSIEHATDRAA